MSSVRSRLRSVRRVPRRRSRRLRSAAGSDTVMEDPIVVEDHTHDESCIDLTSTADDEFVDLTSSQRSHGSGDLLGANDSSVVVIGSPNDSPPAHRRGRRRLPPAEAFDDDLPPVPFDLPSPIPSSSGSSSNFQSPEPIKITCPVCLDDDKTIKKDKRKLATTTCGHVFCQPCVEGSIRTQNCCPVCRKKLTLRNVFVLHI
ncbi:E3 ubiquitin-protein ligase RNF4-like [Mercenaria mercenaria]|uniref:E3 ubiquitin-protein ligase RNF4-like n=1 Tax=Mercenaria mercenaria TaxID=6596 RepID=UPI001E1D8D7B|nr:E3 ubiquitin-protein ligase RNF4-like [Mercenaria mercenaria]